jgi:hypothetical protein
MLRITPEVEHTFFALQSILQYLQGGINVLEHDYSPVGFTESVVQVVDGLPCVLGGLETWPHQQDASQNAITAVAICTQYMLIAQLVSPESSMLTRISLPDLQLHSTHSVPQPVQRMWINFDASRVAVLDQQVDHAMLYALFPSMSTFMHNSFRVQRM